MKLITRQEILDNVHNRWKDQYPTDIPLLNGTSQDIYDRIVALNPRTEKGVNEIIGNDSWTSLKCDECEKRVEAIVQLGEAPDYESSTAHICLKCLSKAVKLIS